MQELYAYIFHYFSIASDNKHLTSELFFVYILKSTIAFHLTIIPWFRFLCFAASLQGKNAETRKACFCQKGTDSKQMHTR